MTQPLAGKHILIVEDEPVFRSLLDSWLSSLGAMTSLAEDGIDALSDKGAYGFNLVFLFLLRVGNLQSDAALRGLLFRDVSFGRAPAGFRTDLRKTYG